MGFTTVHSCTDALRKASEFSLKNNFFTNLFFMFLASLRMFNLRNNLCILLKFHHKVTLVSTRMFGTLLRKLSSLLGIHLTPLSNSLDASSKEKPQIFFLNLTLGKPTSWNVGQFVLLQLTVCSPPWGYSSLSLLISIGLEWV